MAINTEVKPADAKTEVKNADTKTDAKTTANGNGAAKAVPEKSEKARLVDWLKKAADLGAELEDLQEDFDNAIVKRFAKQMATAMKRFSRAVDEMLEVLSS